MGQGDQKATLNLTATSSQLLMQLMDPTHHDAWSAFVARFRPILEGVSRRSGLGREDAADVAQQALMEFFQGYSQGKYVRGKGRLRTWLLTISRRRTIDFMRGHRRHAQMPSGSDAGEVPDDDALDAAWRDEQAKCIWTSAMGELRSETRIDPTNLRIFEMAFIQNVPPETVAKECGVKVQNVYLSISRCKVRLREIIERMNQAYEDDA